MDYTNTINTRSADRFLEILSVMTKVGSRVYTGPVLVGAAVGEDKIRLDKDLFKVQL